MKKTVLFAAAIFTVSAASAQTGEITSAKGENWLSQDGDWGVSFDAQPILNYVGNLFNGNQSNGGVALNNIFSSNNGSQVVIGGKKLIDANTAYRGRVRIGFGSTKNTELVTNITSTDPLATVEDVTKNSFMAINLGAGLEKRVGSTRVVGVYGAEFNIGFGNSKTTKEYGNALSNVNAGPRNTEIKQGSTFGLGLNGFAGVEWFCAPKMSLSGEYAWGIAMASTGLGSTTSESFVNNSTTSTTVDGTPNDGQADKTNTFNIDTGVSGARVALNFYFQ